MRVNDYDLRIGDMVKHLNKQTSYFKGMVGLIVSTGGGELGIPWVQVLWPDGEYPEVHISGELEVIKS
tara:strand:- start:7066 stop:7269 length:204 start_codon:yes stop_codon:yes gene_type:complete